MRTSGARGVWTDAGRELPTCPIESPRSHGGTWRRSGWSRGLAKQRHPGDTDPHRKAAVLRVGGREHHSVAPCQAQHPESTLQGSREAVPPSHVLRELCEDTLPSPSFCRPLAEGAQVYTRFLLHGKPLNHSLTACISFTFAFSYLK